MSVRHLVPDELLLDYTVGSAAPGRALLVASHLEMCEASRKRFAMLQAVGGALLESLEGESLQQVSAEGVIARAEAMVSDDARPRPHEGTTAPPGPLGGRLRGIELPAPLLRYAREVEAGRAWRRLGRGVEAAVLSASTPRGKTQLLWARRGVCILDHTHVGEELVLILKGAFWDDGEYFGPGDVALKDSASTHAPVIDDAEDCLCLSVTEGPIRFVGPYGWLFNAFNRF